MTRRALQLATAFMTFAAAACGGAPDAGGLRESFAQQVRANTFVQNFEHTGDDITFTGPGAEGGTARWRIHIDSAVVEATEDQPEPYKGTVKSSWYSDDVLVPPTGRDSRLPIELLSNGVSQDCWAVWDPTTRSWGWE